MNSRFSLMLLRSFSGLLLFLCLLLATAAFAQSAAPLVGTVVDARTQLPVPFATLAVPGRPGGTVSNIEGSFRLELPTGTDSVRVQALGYAPLTLAVKALSAPLVVRLQPQTYTLQEVVVTALTPTVLLRQAVRNTTARLASPLGLQAYYREFTTYNGQTAKFADALVDYYIEGNSRRPRSPLVQARVQQSRAGQAALSKQDAAAAIPSPVRIDNIGNHYDVLYHNPFLDSTKFKHYTYALLETPAGAAEVPYYEVRCTPTTHDQDHLRQAIVRIDRRTLAIQHIESEVPKELQQYLFGISLFGTKAQLTQYRQRTDYREHNGRLYPSFVRFEYFMDVTKESVLTRYVFTSDMLVRSLLNNPAPIPRKEQYDRPLYQRGTNYQRPYWNEGNVVAATAAEEAAIKALETAK
jgi:hypothetical protein